MKSFSNNRVVNTIWGEDVDRTPIWIMRQAGRYLPEYREIRSKAGSFLNLCKNPELACEVTLQPLARYPLDAAILFSDILTIPDAMGLGLYFKEGEGPCFEKPVDSERAIKNLIVPNPEEKLSYVLDAVRLIKHEIAGKVPLIGFCGSPWTVATYMVEGSANKSFPKIKALMQENPNILHVLLEKLAEAISLHLIAQIKAGAEIVMLFDTWGGMLDTEAYKSFSLKYAKQIIDSVRIETQGMRIPIILFTKGGGKWLNLMSETKCNVLGIDWNTNINEARKLVGNKVALQGNMDPNILFESDEKIIAEVKNILAAYGKGSGHIFNLGHGINKDVDPLKVKVLIDAVHEYSAKYHE